jgi:hydrogen cyanide synthase HcnB
MAEMNSRHVVVVGAGPAGIRAAETLVEHGCQVTLIHEGPAPGGQIYRQQPGGFRRSARTLYGDDADRAVNVHDAAARLIARVAHIPNCTVWNIVDKTLYLLKESGIATLSFDSLVLATGAMDRVLPLPGWTLPGVFSLGGAQIALKHQACAIGGRVAFVGIGPLLYLVAFQYLKAGAGVAGVFDTSGFGTKLAALPRMMSAARYAWRGVRYRRALRRADVPLFEGVRPLRIDGQGSVTALQCRLPNGSTHSVACDAVALGYGLQAESQLAQLAGAQVQFETGQRTWIVRHDGAGRLAPDVYGAGDGIAILGAEAAELTGERAAWSLLQDRGLKPPAARLRHIDRALDRLVRFRTGLDAAFPVPVRQLEEVPDETILCRCETVTVGDARRTIDRFQPRDVNRLKALCRTGMGRCQGRICGLATAELLSQRMGLPIESVGRLRGQSPVKPLPFTLAAKEAEPRIAEEAIRGLAREVAE